MKEQISGRICEELRQVAYNSTKGMTTGQWVIVRDAVDAMLPIVEGELQHLHAELARYKESHAELVEAIRYSISIHKNWNQPKGPSEEIIGYMEAAIDRARRIAE